MRSEHPKNTYKDQGKIPLPHIKKCGNKKCGENMETIYSMKKKKMKVSYRCPYCGFIPPDNIPKLINK